MRPLPRSQVRPDRRQGLLRAGRRLPQHPVHRDPLAPKSVVDEDKAAEKKIKEKEKLLEEYRDREHATAGTLALQAAKDMRAAWKVQGEPKEDVAKVAAREKLDYEFFDCWVKFLAKPPNITPT